MGKKRPSLADLRIAVRTADGRLLLGAYATLTNDRLGGPQLVSGTGDATLAVTRHGSGTSNLHWGTNRQTVAREWRGPVDFVKGFAEVVDQAGFDVLGSERSYRQKPDTDKRRTAVLVESEAARGFGYECWAVDPARCDLLVALLRGAYDMPGAMVQAAVVLSGWTNPVIVLRGVTLAPGATDALKGSTLDPDGKGQATGLLYPRDTSRFFAAEAQQRPARGGKWTLRDGLYRVE